MSFTRFFGIEAPVVEPPVAPAPSLVAAVSNAGGLGLLSVTWLDEAAVRGLFGRLVASLPVVATGGVADGRGSRPSWRSARTRRGCERASSRVRRRRSRLSTRIG
jgi:NAD(P)H-dependent flavin oxidoreductase YrpB (nitropropane dioxygenase family)